MPGYSSWGQISAELTHGSLASMANVGVFFQDGLTDNAWGDRADYTAHGACAVAAGIDLT